MSSETCDRADEESAAAAEARGRHELVLAAIKILPQLLSVLILGSLLLVYRTQLERLFFNASKVTVAGVTLEAAAGVIGSAAQSRAVDAAGNRTAALWLHASANCLRDSKILWVSDSYQGDLALIEILQSYGAHVRIVQTNMAAGRLLAAAEFDVVVSDLGREAEGADKRVGRKMVDVVKEHWPLRPPPVIFYVVEKRPEDEKAVQFITNAPDEPVYLLTARLEDRRKPC